MVYVSEEGEVVCDYLNPKKLLDTMRLLCRGKDKPITHLCKIFNEQTMMVKICKRYLNY